MDNHGLPVKHPHQQLHQISITGGEKNNGSIPISGGSVYSGGNPISGDEIHTDGFLTSGGPVYSGGIPITGGAPLNHRPGYCEEKLRNQPQHNSISAGRLR